MNSTATSTDSVEEYATRRTLLVKLKNWEDQRSWQEFFDTYWRLIYRVARKAGLDEAAAQDVVQETVLAVAKTMPRYEYDPARCSFKGWLMHLTRCRIADQFRKRARQVPIAAPETEETGRTAFLDRLEDPKGLPTIDYWDAEFEQNLLEQALDRVKEKVNAKHYEIFCGVVIKQASPQEVARLCGVQVAQVYLAKHRVAAVVKEELGRLKSRWK
jgi:RNA polymerase sigma factor (sigma-70 family)